MANGSGLRERPHLEGDSPPIRELREKIGRAAKSLYPVLILGERGTGKELVAYELYRSSDRTDRKFLICNVGALDPGVANSELFGHVKHAFTGANNNRDGLFRAANGGTLFLDEIGNTNLDLQGKLLRAVEYGEVVPVGADIPLRVDVRVIAATNADLEELAAQSKFRQDLIDRFIIRVRVPPLRECGDDCVLLANKFLREEAQQQKRIDTIHFSGEAEGLIRRYGWPGNGRELLNRVRVAVLMVPNGVHEWEVPANHLEIGPLPASPPAAVPGVSQEQSHQQTLADLVLDGLLRADPESVLDPLREVDDPKHPATRYIVEQLELGLVQFMETEVGKALLRSKPNGAILAERFNLSRRTDTRKKSFSRLIRDRLNQVLDRCRENLELERSAARRRGAHAG